MAYICGDVFKEYFFHNRCGIDRWLRPWNTNCKEPRMYCIIPNLFCYKRNYYNDQHRANIMLDANLGRNFDGS